MDIWVKLIELLKGLKTSRIILLTVISMLLFITYKFEVFAPYIIKHDSNNTTSQPNYLANINELNADVDSIAQVLDSTLATSSSYVQFIGVFKFLPEGKQYLYQGRGLVGFSHKYNIDTTAIIDSLHYKWAPIWSGKTEVEEILQKKPFLILVDYIDLEIVLKVYGQNKVTELPSVNLYYLYDLNIRYLYKFPIVNGSSEVIGYVVIGASEHNMDMNRFRNELFTLSRGLSSKVQNYIVK